MVTCQEMRECHLDRVTSEGGSDLTDLPRATLEPWLCAGCPACPCCGGAALRWAPVLCRCSQGRAMQNCHRNPQTALGSFSAFSSPACHLGSSSSVFTPLEYSELFSDLPPALPAFAQRFSSGPITSPTAWLGVAAAPRGTHHRSPGHASLSGSSHQILKLPPGLFVCHLCLGMCFPPVLGLAGVWHLHCRKVNMGLGLWSVGCEGPRRLLCWDLSEPQIQHQCWSKPSSVPWCGVSSLTLRAFLWC